MGREPEAFGPIRRRGYPKQALMGSGNVGWASRLHSGWRDQGR